MLLDLEKLKTPVSENDPSGGSMEYDALYLDLDMLAQGTPASQIGDSIIEGKEPNWRKLQENCLLLWEHTRDLRVAAYIALSGLALDGLQGFAGGLELIKYLFEEQWDSFYPRLDPDDDNDPLERINIITMLSPPPGAYNDPLHFLSLFRNQRLSPVGPKYTLRDLMIAEGELEGTDENIDPALLKAEISAVPAEELQKQGNLVEQIQKLLLALDKAFEEKENRYSLSFVLLKDELKKLKNFYSQYTFATAQSSENDEIDKVDNTESSSGEIALKGENEKINLVAVRIKNRAEALMMLRKCSEYFQIAEPTSPVSYLINRAVRMADMNFMDLLAEIDQNSLERGRDILGVRQIQDDN